MKTCSQDVSECLSWSQRQPQRDTKNPKIIATFRVLFWCVTGFIPQVLFVLCANLLYLVCRVVRLNVSLEVPIQVLAGCKICIQKYGERCMRVVQGDIPQVVDGEKSLKNIAPCTREYHTNAQTNKMLRPRDSLWILTCLL